MRYLLIFSLLLPLASCGSLESDAGKSRYRYEFVDKDGSKHTFDLQNGKDVGKVMASLKYKDIFVELYEEGVNASDPMRVMAESQGKLIDHLLKAVP